MVCVVYGQLARTALDRTQVGDSLRFLERLAGERRAVRQTDRPRAVRVVLDVDGPRYDRRFGARVAAVIAIRRDAHAVFGSRARRSQSVASRSEAAASIASGADLALHHNLVIDVRF